MDASLDGAQLLAAVRERIEANPCWLFILDNADDLSLFGVTQTTQDTSESTAIEKDEVINMFEYVPRATTGTVLWTSRDKGIGGSLVGAQRAINVARMTDGEARVLFESSRASRIGAAEREDANRLLLELNWLPLAISQTAAYMRRTSMSIGEYLSVLGSRTERWKVLEETEFDRHRRPQVSNSILSTWDMSIEHIRQENKLAYNMLHILAFLDNQNIQYEIIERIAVLDRKKESASDSQPSSIAVNWQVDSGDDEEEHDFRFILKAITRLQEFSFLHDRESRNSSRSYEMHKLVQEAIRYGLSRKGRHEEEVLFSGTALRAISRLYPQHHRGRWDECEKYLTHALRASEWGGLCDREVEAANLLTRVSQYLYHCGRWRESEPVNKWALELRQEKLGDRHADTLSSMAELATTYRGQRRLDEALEMSSRVLALRREVLGDNDPLTFNSMASLGLAYLRRERLDEAESLLAEVLELRREAFGEADTQTVGSMNDLAITYLRQHRYDAAEEILLKVVAARQKALGRTHYKTLGNTANLAFAYKHQGRLEESEKLYITVLEGRKQALGGKHPDTLSSMSDLAGNWDEQGKHLEAIALIRECFDLQSAVLGINHEKTQRSLSIIHAMEKEAEEREQKGEGMEKGGQITGQEAPHETGQRRTQEVTHDEEKQRIQGRVRSFIARMLPSHHNRRR